MTTRRDALKTLAVIPLLPIVGLPAAEVVHSYTGPIYRLRFKISEEAILDCEYESLVFRPYGRIPGDQDKGKS